MPSEKPEKQPRGKRLYSFSAGTCCASPKMSLPLSSLSLDSEKARFFGGPSFTCSAKILLPCRRKGLLVRCNK